MKNTIDLHTHSTKSDGTFTPNELLTLAEHEKLAILSITDHESVDAYYDMNRNLFSGKIIPGIELRTSCFGVAIELLGYGFDIDKMKETIKKYHYKNTEELDSYMIHLAYEQYTKKGVKLNSNFIDEFNTPASPRLSKYVKSAIMNHPENEIFSKEIPEGKSFFRTCMTNPNHPLFLDLSPAFPTVAELIKAIKDAGGIVSIPHIFQYKEYAKKILFHLLDNYDIDLVECYYSSFTPEQTEFLIDVCKKYNKHISGGSDFHGSIRPNVELGKGTNKNLQIPEESINAWLPSLKNII
ncbi:MAG: hypothetical protein IJW20_06835 [Clostridia bacterium]|nr:hypothetical protein [Clostridia bacterium]